MIQNNLKMAKIVKARLLERKKSIESKTETIILA